LPRYSGTEQQRRLRFWQGDELPAETRAFFLTVQGRRLEVQRIAGTAGDAPTLVFLHEGLGSISLWRDFPARVVERTGCPAVVYSRYGHGNSEVLQEPRTIRFMHDEGQQVLPELLEKLSIREPVLMGHSDGASIAIIYAGAGNPVRGLVLMAPHLFAEEWGLKSIAKAKAAFESTDLPQKLSRHHVDAAKTFRGWNDVWLLPEFREWNIEDCLQKIKCPILAIQGYEDEYGTMAQIDAIAAKSGGQVETLRLPDCGHSPHRDQPDAVLHAIGEFLQGMGNATEIRHG
jgi:pimeloyl-ACP methyl ester carboxylesterase